MEVRRLPLGVEVIARDLKQVEANIDALLLKEALVLIRGVILEPSDEERLMKKLPWDSKAALRDVSGPYFAAGTGIIESVNAKGDIVGCARWKLPEYSMIQVQGAGKLTDHYKIPDGELKSKWATREFHTDGPHDTPSSTLPPVATSMYCIETPKEGGETLFADTRLGFHSLDEETKALALRLDALYDHHFREMEIDGCRAASPLDTAAREITNRWPLVILDREAEPALYLGPAFTQCLIDRISGKKWSPDETQAFLGMLMRVNTSSIYTHIWKPNDLVIWDNRRLVHSATPSDKYKHQRRLIHRIRMSSRVPIVPAAHSCTSIQLDLYARVWAAQQLLSSGFIAFLAQVLVTADTDFTKASFSLASKTDSQTWILWILYLAVLIMGASRSLSFLRFSHFVNLIVHARKLPMVWDFEFWDGLTELSVILLPPMDAAALIRWQMITFYTATVIFKFTYSFLNPRLSCAPIFVLSLLDSVLPASIEPSVAILTFLNITAPGMTVLIEATIPTLLAFRPYFGICLALFFHLLIAVTPPPNNAGGFSVSVAVRYAVFFVVGNKKLNSSSQLLLLASPILVATAYLLGKERGNDWAVPVYAGISVALLSQAFSSNHFLTTKKKSSEFTMSNKFYWFRLLLKGLTVIYTILPVLGFHDMMAATMFANLRVYTRSNHAFLPTSLFQEYSVVRIDLVTSPAFNDVHPNEATSIFSERLSSWLPKGGHAGRQFAPYVKRAINCTLQENRPESFTPYLIPDIELRRLLSEARAHSDDFSLVYTKIPSGDQVHYDAANNSCSILPSPSSENSKQILVCSPDELPFAPPLSFWQDKFLLFFSIPLDDPTAISPDASELGCLC